MQNAATRAQQLMQGKNLQQIKNDMLVNGWSDAGVWWWTINKMNQSVTEAASAIPDTAVRSEEHTSELQSLMRISYAVFCLKKKKPQHELQYIRTVKTSTNKHSHQQTTQSTTSTE